MDVQRRESPRSLELVRCLVAATNGTASRGVSPSQALPFRAHLRLGMGVQRDHVQQPQLGYGRARPRCLNPHDWDAWPTGVILQVPPCVEIRMSRRSPPLFPCGDVRAKWLGEHVGLRRPSVW
jgi:hypothetical protein